MSETLAFVAAAGGAGATRLSIETAAALGRAGDEAVVLDAALGTQGLAAYVEGRVDPDLTSVLTDDAALTDALVDVPLALDGRLAVCPALAPFERLARAKTPAAAERFEQCVRRAAAEFDRVIVDVPPVADNPAVAAVTTVDRRVVVAPDSRRGADLVPQAQGRLVDVGATAEGLLANRVDGEQPSALPDADYAVPAGERDVTRPVAATGDGEFAAAVGTVVEALFDRELGIEPASGGVLGR